MVVATAALWGALGARVGAVAVLPADLAAAAALAALAVVDLRHQLLPRRIIVPAGVAVLAQLAVAYLVFAVLRVVSPRPLGGGDVDRVALLGLTLGC